MALIQVAEVRGLSLRCHISQCSGLLGEANMGRVKSLRSFLKLWGQKDLGTEKLGSTPNSCHHSCGLLILKMWVTITFLYMLDGFEDCTR